MEFLCLLIWDSVKLLWRWIVAAVEAIERYEYFGAYATVIAECLHPTKDFAQVPFQPCVREVNELVDSS